MDETKQSNAPIGIAYRNPSPLINTKISVEMLSNVIVAIWVVDGEGAESSHIHDNGVVAMIRRKLSEP